MSTNLSESPDSKAIQQPEPAEPPAQHYSPRAMLRRALRAPLTYIGAFFIAYKPVIQAVYWVIDFYGNMQTVSETLAALTKPAISAFFKTIDFLNTGWGTVALMLLGFGLIALQLFIQHRRMHRALKASPIEIKGEGVVTGEEAKEPVPEQTQTEGGEKPSGWELTPAYLVDFYKRFPSEKAKAMAEVFIGHWMKLPVTVIELRRDSDGKCSHIKFGMDDVWGDGSNKVQVFLDFGKGIPDYLSALREYEKVTVRGRVKEIAPADIALQNCEIVVPSIAELAKREKIALIDSNRPVYLSPEYIADLSKRYRDDPVGLKDECKRWEGHWVELVGYFGSTMHLNQPNSPLIMHFQPLKSGYLVGTRMTFGREWEARLRLLRPGDPVRVRGKITKFELPDLFLNDCAIRDL